jgi:hypothetical protein
MESPIQNKLLHYEIQPPEGAWDKIAESLDESISTTLSQKLYQYEEPPLHDVWHKIALQLGDQGSEKAKVVPFFVRYRRPLKYSGAVAIFIFFAVVTSLLVSKKTESEIPAQGITNDVKTKKDTSLINGNLKNTTAVPPIERNNAEKTIANSKAGSIRSGDTPPSISYDQYLFPSEAQPNEIFNGSVSSDKYMIYSDGDGNAIRLPKKIYSAFACETNDFVCKQRLQKLRQKFAASAVTTDFTGILQILKSLQENQ